MPTESYTIPKAVDPKLWRAKKHVEHYHACIHCTLFLIMDVANSSSGCDFTAVGTGSSNEPFPPRAALSRCFVRKTG